jgi:hypothetical protein
MQIGKGLHVPYPVVAGQGFQSVFNGGLRARIDCCQYEHQRSETE